MHQSDAWVSREVARQGGVRPAETTGSPEGGWQRSGRYTTSREPLCALPPDSPAEPKLQAIGAARPVRNHQRMPPTTVAAFAAEAANLTAAMATVTEDEFARPTRCDPWTVRDLLAHVGMATDIVAGMLAEPAPASAEIDAAGYYRPDKRFSAATNSARVAAAIAAAQRAESGAHLVGRFDRTWREVYALVTAQPANRIVRTRHGEAITLADFMITRVVELAVHGLDLADALARRPWLHDAAAKVVTRLLLPRGSESTMDSLGWDRLTLLRKATGRDQVTDTERDRLRDIGLAWLALG